MNNKAMGFAIMALAAMFWYYYDIRYCNYWGFIGKFVQDTVTLPLQMFGALLNSLNPLQALTGGGGNQNVSGNQQIPPGAYQGTYQGGGIP